MYDAKDEMIAMEEARIDKVEEAINKEIEAYQDLIDVKKEELDAERELFEFKKDVESQTKDIAALERRIASLSGSTNASDIAERRKLEAQLAEANEGLSDTYYNHSKDSQSKALDDEMNAFQEAKDNMIEILREGLENTEEIFKKLIGEVALNADTIGENINETAKENGITLSSLLTSPWIAAGTASTTLKENIDVTLASMIGDDGIITVFSAAVLEGLSKPFLDVILEGTGPIAQFENATKTAIDNVKLKVNGEDGNSNYLGDTIAQPWKDGSKAANTFATDVGKALDEAIRIAKEKVPELQAVLDIDTPDLEGGNGGSGNDGSPPTTGYNNGNLTTAQIKEMQTFLGVTADGKWGPKSQAAAQTKWGVSSAGDSWSKYVPKSTGTTTQSRTLGSQSFVDSNTVTIDGIKYYVDEDGLYYKIDDLSKVRYDGGRSIGWSIPKNTTIYKQYAKGTLGTKKDEWAITDESWIGEEITLAAGKNGQLQYLKKGSAVMPADISANLVEWGKLDPNMMNLTNPTANINMISNAVNKPELNLTFDSLVHVDHCDEGTLKNLEKMVDMKINDFSKQLNYSIKKFAR